MIDSALRIGSLTLDSPVMLAPMAGYTNAPLRHISRAFGAGLTYTEVINAAGVVHDSRQTFFLLESDPEEIPVAAHIYGADPLIMGEAAARIEALGRFASIDINCGCPVRKIVAKGAGAALMRNPALIEKIVASVRERVSLPVTVKTRIGFTPGEEDPFEIAAAAEAGGADAIAIHARYARDRHAGSADWDLLARIKQARGIPIIGNGGIESASDVVRMLEVTGVDGVMIARAAMGNPWIFREANILLRGGIPTGHTAAEHRAVIEDHFHRVEQHVIREDGFRRKSNWHNETTAALAFRRYLVQYLRGFHGASVARRRLDDVRSREAVFGMVDEVMAAEAMRGQSSRLGLVSASQAPSFEAGADGSRDSVRTGDAPVGRDTT